jgi:DNA-binding response OmpR family regulator
LKKSGIFFLKTSQKASESSDCGKRRQPVPDSSQSQSRILIIDDDEANRLILDNLLKKAGMNTLMAPDGESGFRLAAELLPDLIVMDYFMPGEFGMDLLLRFKTDARCRNIPVLVLTLMENESVKKQVLDTGAADYLTKPFDMKEVVERILSHLKR